MIIPLLMNWRRELTPSSFDEASDRVVLNYLSVHSSALSGALPDQRRSPQVHARIRCVSAGRAPTSNPSSRSVGRKSLTSTWRHSTSSTRKTFRRLKPGCHSQFGEAAGA